MRSQNRNKKRDRWEIILDILEGISEERGGVKKTRIMQKTYLDWRNFKKHFNFLLENGFVRNTNNPDERTSTSYCVTEEGEGLLRKLREVELMLR